MQKCAEIVDKEDIENAYYICLDMMENPEELKAKLKKQYRYNDDRKLINM